MIVVDSSVWIGHLRGAKTRAVKTFDATPAPYETLLVGDLVLLEILRGARSDEHALRLERWLRRFSVEQMLDEQIAVQAARNDRVLRARGIALDKTVDLIIATYCVERGHSLLHDDRDFDALAPALGLRLA